MKCIRAILVGGLAFAVGAACADEVPTGPTGPQVGIEIAPLTLTNHTDVCYALTVFNGVPGATGTDTVWTQGNVCSTQFGNLGGGAISYVGPCDASVSGNNHVRLVLTSISDSTGALTDGTDYINPCPSTDGCVRDFKCEENADVFVEFNLTVMRRAQQGFFDIAVNFEDIFCSAKLDTCYDVGPVRATVTVGSADLAGYRYTFSDANYVGVWRGTADSDWDLYAQTDGASVGSFKGGAADAPPTTVDVSNNTYTLSTNPGTPINLLHGPDDIGRQHTAVAGLACTAGPDADGSKLLLTTPTLTCKGTTTSTFSLDLAAATGGNATASATEQGDTSVLRYAVYFGEEQLNCGVDGEQNPISCNKIYYNIALNIGHLAGGTGGLRDCTFAMNATAVDTGDTETFAAGALADDSGVYPMILFDDVEVIGGSGPICTANPLDGTGSAVKTGYIKGADYTTAGEAFKATYSTDGTAAAVVQ